jgi:TrmH family RNA methyltransferase
MPDTVITSLQNERIKAIRALEMRKVRNETGLFVAEGASVLITAAEQRFRPETLVVGPEGRATPAARELIADADRAGATILDVSNAVLEKIAAKDNPQSLIGVFAQRWDRGPDAASAKPGDLWIVLDGIRDPGNLGTIIRTADAVGARGVLLVGPTCDPWSREAVRASMGSIFAVPIARLAGSGLSALLKTWPGPSIATHLQASEDFRRVRPKGATLLIMGAEGPGLADPIADACTHRVRIPMAGRLDSLNLAVATALMLYEIRRPQLKL